MRLRLTPAARRDVRTIVASIRPESRSGAERVARRIRETTRLIADNPSIGIRTSRPGLLRLRVRPFPYVVFYEVSDAEVLVIGVRHGARDPRSMPDAP